MEKIIQDQLKRVEKRYQELDHQLAMPEITSDLERLQALAQEKAGLEDLVTKYREYKAVSGSLKETRAMLDSGLDEDMTALARQEIASLEPRLD